MWSVDSCGELEVKQAECGPRACRDGACEPPDPTPCREPVEGRCDGTKVKLCQAGRSQTIDCAARGLTCVMTPEGADCAEEVPRHLRCSGPPRCEGDVLVTCEAGRKVLTDCEAERAICGKLPDSNRLGCVRVVPSTEDACGPCGCGPIAGATESTCDGRDDDGDGYIDEALDCGPVPVVAFIVTDAAGNTSHAQEDVEEELARANALFAASIKDAPIRLELDELIWLADDRLRELSDDEFMALAQDPRVHPIRDEFYVPIVFTDILLSEGNVPKVGVSTLPNGTCGGVHFGKSPDVGLVAVAKARAPTTVAHELGHFLGLCHTHETRARAVALVSEQAGSGTLVACSPACNADGDGICDTPHDPGPEECTYDAECLASCRHGDEPETRNLMSYYTACRVSFTPEQARLMQHTLALRRGWHRCLGGVCPCRLGVADDCPSDMSCRPVTLAGELTARCTFDGPKAPGSDCDNTSECGKSALCLEDPSGGLRRCARTCQRSYPGCECVQANEHLSICLEDMQA